MYIATLELQFEFLSDCDELIVDFVDCPRK
ncbi:hypothetical protein GGD68_002567 [Paraburkholderia fungorum]|uniref:Transposase n=1 Tax=Paraburkholderia fungorum TaxID=134537 RepID=A0AAW3UQX6_9BURK|nr:hypothetical protein [Paraburkholderia fungorum]MBB6201047.1 hypothetical protein [Paraburkholderia fungorum]